MSNVGNENNYSIEKEALEFIQSFLDTEYKVTLAKGREDLDKDGFKQEVQKLDAFYKEGLKSGVIRPRNPGDENFSSLAEEVKINTVRKVFLIRAYKNADYGIVYRAYAGTDREKGNRYFYSYYFSKIESDYKIIAQYVINESHTAWEWKQGIKFKNDSFEFLEVNRFIEPNAAKDSEDYFSEAGIDYVSSINNKSELKGNLTNRDINESKEKQKTMEIHEDMEEAEINNSLSSRLGQGGMTSRDAWRAMEQGEMTSLNLLKGRFYTNGFFREGSNPKAVDLPGKELKDAIAFSKDIVKILRNGECTALESEGDKTYFPFVYCGEMLLDGLPDFAAKDDVPKGAVVEYDQLDERSCIFWYDDFAEEYEEDLAPESLEAFQLASNKMKASLEDLVEFAVKYGIEYPVIIGGTFCSGIFAGVITTRVRT
jgi:hypothetical protein